MAVGSLILVETSAAGNLGAAMRVAANFSVPRLHLVRPRVDPETDEVRRWSRAAQDRLVIAEFDSVTEAAAGCRTLVATASARGREGVPVMSLAEAPKVLVNRDLQSVALLFGCETSGLSRTDLDVADMVVRIPTDPDYPVLNLVQAVAIVLSHLSISLQADVENEHRPAPNQEIEDLMVHLHEALQAIDFLDPLNPHRMLRKIRRLVGRASPDKDEVRYLRGICRQTLWAAKIGPLGKNDDD